MSKISKECLSVWEIWFSLLFQRKLYILFSISFLIYFGIIFIWTMYQSLDKRIQFIMIFLPIKDSLTLFQMWNFFVKLWLILSQSVLSREEFTKLTQAFWREVLTLSFVLAYQFYFYISQPIRLDFFEKFVFELESSSYSFKITCILLRQVISPKKMVMSSGKFTNLILWSAICTPFILLLASMKLASTSATIIYNTNESGHPWRTPCIGVKGWDRRPFILNLDWMLVYVTFIIQMNFSPHPNFCKTGKTNSQSTLPYLRYYKEFFIQFIWHIN